MFEKINTIKKETELDLSPAQQGELEKRLKKYEHGELDFKSWEETKASIRKRSKDAF